MNVEPTNPKMDRAERFGFGVTLQSANKKTYPILYDDDVWDVAESGTSLCDVTKKEGQFTQTAINEILAYKANPSYHDGVRINQEDNTIHCVIDEESDVFFTVSENGLKVQGISDTISSTTKSIYEDLTMINISLEMENAETKTSCIEIGSGATVSLYYTISGNVHEEKCMYMLYGKVSGETEYEFLKVLTDEETEAKQIDGLEVGIEDYDFMLMVKAKDNPYIKGLGLITATHVLPTYYGTMKVSGSSLSQDFENAFPSFEKAIVPKMKYTLDFGGPYYNTRNVIAIPKEYGLLKTLRDISHFDYINNYGSHGAYDVNTELMSTHDVYIKKTDVTNLDSFYKLTMSFGETKSFNYNIDMLTVQSMINDAVKIFEGRDVEWEEY